MYRICTCPIVTIHLENGVYLFDGNSATGKTRLMELLNRISDSTYCVLGYTYSDTRKIALCELLNKNHYEVVLVDRADMYLTQEDLEFLIKYAKEAIVMIDYKGNSLDVEYLEDCYILMTEEKIEVVS